MTQTAISTHGGSSVTLEDVLKVVTEQDKVIGELTSAVKDLIKVTVLPEEKLNLSPNSQLMDGQSA